MLNLLSFQTTILSETRLFQLISLFSQISTKKLQNPLFKIIWLLCLYILK